MDHYQISEFMLNDKNPRTISKENRERLKRDLKADTDFLKVNKIKVFLMDGKMVIYAGNMRMKMLMELGYEKIPKEWIAIDGDIVKKNGKIDTGLLNSRIFKDNESCGQYDKDLLLEYYDYEYLKGLDLSNLNLSLDDIEVDMAALDLDDDKKDDMPDLPDEPIVKLGDVFQLGNHTLLCGDSLDIENYEMLFKNGRYQLLVTDPPYNVNYESTAGKIANDNMTSQAFGDFLLKIFGYACTYHDEGGPYYIFHADTEGANFRAKIVEAGYKLSQCLIRVKDAFVMGRQDYHRIHEPILYGWKEGKRHTRKTDRKQTTVWNYDRPKKSEIHPTMKPVDMVSYAIENSSRQKDTVFDPFSGSGSTLIACERTNRICKAIEFDPKYAQATIKRYYEYTKGKREIKCINRKIDILSIFK